MSATLVSAVMPVYNGEEFLETAITSLFEQDYPALEIVVCNDGSTDRTGEIVRSFDSVRVVEQENRGVAAALNAAIEASTGDFVATCGCDDRWPPNRMTLQATHLEEHPRVGCVLGRQEWINPPPWLGRDPVYGELDGIPLGSAMFRRGSLTQLGGFDESFRHSEDMDLLVRLREHGIQIAVLPEVIHYRRFHGGNLTASPPETSPLLRSLRSKLDRERATAEDS